MAALPDSPVVWVEEYLRTSYEPDMEFVDGVCFPHPSAGTDRHL